MAVLTIEQMSLAANKITAEQDNNVKVTLQTKLVSDVVETLSKGGTTLEKISRYLPEAVVDEILDLSNVGASSFVEKLPANAKNCLADSVDAFAVAGSKKTELVKTTRTDDSTNGGSWAMVKMYNNDKCGGILSLQESIGKNSLQILAATTITFSDNVYVAGTRKMKFKTLDNPMGVERKIPGYYLYLKGTKYCTGHAIKADGSMNTDLRDDLLRHEEKIEELKREKELAALTSKAADTMDGNPSVGIAVFGEMD